MGIFDRIKQVFGNNPKVEIKASENLGSIMTPIFREIPPDRKAGLFTREGMRSWAYIAMSAIADEISTIDMELYQKQKGGWEEIEDHLVLNLMQKPNQIQTKEEFLWLVVIYLLAEGEAPIVLNNPKNPTEMALLNPSRIQVIFDEQSIVSGYKYQKTNGQFMNINADSLIFLKFPNYLTPFRGMGIMKYVAQTLDIDNYIEEYLRLFFYNDATPGSVLQTDKELSKDVYKRLENQLRQKHQGFKKAHKNMILEGGLKWNQITMKLNEMQIKELNDTIRGKVLAAFKVPKSILGITEDVNRANGENSDRVFAKRCLLPKMRLIAGNINQFLIPKFSDGQNLWFEFENPVKDDELIQSQVDVAYSTAGIWTIDEIRERMGMPPINEVTPPEENPDDLDEEKKYKKKHINPGKIYKFKLKEGKMNKFKTDALAEYLKDILREEKKVARKEYSNDEKSEFHNKKIEMTDTIENNYKVTLRKYFKELSVRIIDQIKSYKKALKVTIDKKKEQEIMMEISIPFIEEAVVKESELAYALLNLSGNVIDPQDKLVQEFLQARALKLGESTSQTTVDDVDSILKNWSENEGTSADLKSILKDYFDSSEKDRVDMIARTEVSRAVGFAQETVYQEVGAEGKQWITAEDEKVCEFCAEMDGKTTGVSDNFWDQGDSMMGSKGGSLDLGFDDVSSPPLHPDCRCDLIPIFVEGKNMDDFKNKNKEKADRIAKTEEREKEIEEKKNQIDLQELKLIEKEQKISKKEKEIEKTLNELEKLK